MSTEPSADQDVDLADDRVRDRTDDRDEDQGDDQGGGIHFHFPIDIRLVGGSDDGLVDQVVERVFDELRRELERRA